MSPTEMTWQTLATVGGLAVFLSLIVLPAAKALLGICGRGTLIVGFVAGQALAQIAAVYLHGLSGRGAADAFLTGLVGAAMATGLHQGYKAVVGRLE